MKISASAIAILSIMAAGSASAAEKLADVDYLKVHRCKGLATGLGSPEAGKIEAFLKDQGGARQAYVVERGRTEASRAKRETRSDDRRERLTAELNGPCMAYLSVGGANLGAQ